MDWKTGLAAGAGGLVGAVAGGFAGKAIAHGKYKGAAAVVGLFAGATLAAGLTAPATATTTTTTTSSKTGTSGLPGRRYGVAANPQLAPRRAQFVVDPTAAFREVQNAAVAYQTGINYLVGGRETVAVSYFRGSLRSSLSAAVFLQNAQAISLIERVAKGALNGTTAQAAAETALAEAENAVAGSTSRPQRR